MRDGGPNSPEGSLIRAPKVQTARQIDVTLHPVGRQYIFFPVSTFNLNRNVRDSNSTPHQLVTETVFWLNVKFIPVILVKFRKFFSHFVGGVRWKCLFVLAKHLVNVFVPAVKNGIPHCLPFNL